MARELTIVIHDWNGEDRGPGITRSLEATEAVELHRVVVVEEKKASSSAGFWRSLGFEVVAAENGSSSGSRKNIGLKNSAGDVLLVSNDVLTDDRDWLDELLGKIEACEDVGVAGCRLSDGAGRVIGAGSSIVGRTCEITPLGTGEKDINQFGLTREVDSADSSFMFVSREAIEKAGGFEEGYSGCYQDADFCLKVKTAGLKVVCLGGLGVSMRAGPEGPTGPDRSGEAHSAFCERWSDFMIGRYQTSLMWQSFLRGAGEFAAASRCILPELDSLGVDVCFGSVSGADDAPDADGRLANICRKSKDLDVVQVLFAGGDLFYKNSGGYRIGYSMSEVSGIPPEWVEQANSMDEIWVPSSFNRDTFGSCGVQSPIKVMPLGVDTDHFNRLISSRRLDSCFVFLSVFDWVELKAPEVLLQSYNQEFSSSDDVLLLLMVANPRPSLDVRGQVESMRLRPEGPPVVIIENQRAPDYQMGSLYCSSDCFVLPTRGEGWGRRILEAMSCGLPVVSTAWGAQRDYINEETGYPLEVKGLVPAGSGCVHYQGFNWADPDPEHLAALMRHVYEHPREGKEKGLRASISVSEERSWTHSAANVKARLLEISG